MTLFQYILSLFKASDKNEIDVLARTIYGEARNQNIKGMEAVANVVLNRVRTAKRKGDYWWGNDIVSVCRKPYQFSCWNKNDPNYEIITKVKLDNRKFRMCMEIAEDAVIGDLLDNTKGADHYHATYVSPYWAKNQKPTVKIGDHIFYKLGD